MHAHDASVCKQAAALLRNLAGNDAVKTSLCTVEMVQLLLGAVKTHVKDPAMHGEYILMCLPPPFFFFCFSMNGST